MLKVYYVIALSSTFLFCHVTAACDCGGCPPLPINHFQWLNPDGSLVISQTAHVDEALSKNEEFGYCGPTSSDKWRPLPESPSCQFCSSNATLVCEGSDVYNVPSPATLPSTTLSLFKMSGVGLISLPPKCFSGLYIQKLVIENSNLSYIALETFIGVKYIKYLYLRKNMLDYIPQADGLFHNINGLKYLSLEDSGLRVLTSSGSANMHSLTYFSLAGNPLYTMDVSFLQNSGLTFLDLKNITLKMKNADIKGTGLSKLPNSLETIDLSRATVTSEVIDKFMKQLSGKNITTLSLSYLQTQFRSFWPLTHVKTHLQYLSLKGIDLHTTFNNSKKTEKRLLKTVQFSRMKELNLEDCNISFIESGDIFNAFPNLTVLSLAGNRFLNLDIAFFSYLPKLIFMDFSDSTIFRISHTVNVKDHNLQALDLSGTAMLLNEEESAIFFSTLKNVQILSLCKTQVMTFEIANALLNINNLKYLDLTATFSTVGFEPEINNLFSNNKLTLIELHFTQNNFKLLSDYPSFFSQLNSLETLDISNNLIRELSDEMFPPTLRILNVSQNLITTWYFSALKNESQLQFLDVSNNQITYITEAMIEDFYKLNSLSLSSNPLICNNKVVALVCSNIKNNTQNFNETEGTINGSNIVSSSPEASKNTSQTLILIDWQHYRCYDINSNGFRRFSQEKDCNEYYEEVSTTHDADVPTTQYHNKQTTIAPILPTARKSAWNWEWIYFIVGPVVLCSVLGSIVVLKWWNIRCFLHRYFSLKKARLIRKNGNLLAKPEVFYDVFVSYSDVDRAWVLDHLIPNMEGNGDLSLCFHERDFQVGMSILENIIDCMDRSHALLLVVSSAFIYSKWCQFEMHLAQYRLIETFRDRLVLVLLEDIPRKARPQTLHHLMMTKTYLMWPLQPCKEDAYELFWRRLKRALRQNSNCSIPT